MGQTDKPTHVVYVGGSELQQGDKDISERKVKRIAGAVACLSEQGNLALMCGLKEQIGAYEGQSVLEYAQSLVNVRGQVSRAIWKALSDEFSERNFWKTISSSDTKVFIGPNCDPEAIESIDQIREIVEDGWLQLCCFGGGIPVVKTEGREVYDIFTQRTVDSVISNGKVNRDFETRTLELLVEGLDSSLVFVVNGGCIFDGTGEVIRDLTVMELEKLVKEGEIENGEKIDFLLRMLERENRRIVVCDLNGLESYCDGDSSEVTVIHS